MTGSPTFTRRPSAICFEAFASSAQRCRYRSERTARRRYRFDRERTVGFKRFCRWYRQQAPFLLPVGLTAMPSPTIFQQNHIRHVDVDDPPESGQQSHSSGVLLIIRNQRF
ncbi:hypothetical protein KCP76_01895 [Salmonella enterica subsp. enterica serovar Weltevreden]|nr:hypothetical protein KCP76_01895 [Salmonella enterica subsp. enterica serovar Weltevreden]